MSVGQDSIQTKIDKFTKKLFDDNHQNSNLISMKINDFDLEFTKLVPEYKLKEEEKTPKVPLQSIILDSLKDTKPKREIVWSIEKLEPLLKLHPFNKRIIQFEASEQKAKQARIKASTTSVNKITKNSKSLGTISEEDYSKISSNINKIVKSNFSNAEQTKTLPKDFYKFAIPLLQGYINICWTFPPTVRSPFLATITKTNCVDYKLKDFSEESYCFENLKKKLENREYNYIEEFESDILKHIHNILTYYPASDPAVEKAQEFEVDFKKSWDNLKMQLLQNDK